MTISADSVVSVFRALLGREPSEGDVRHFSAKSNLTLSSLIEATINSREFNDKFVRKYISNSKPLWSELPFLPPAPKLAMIGGNRDLLLPIAVLNKALQYVGVQIVDAGDPAAAAAIVFDSSCRSRASDEDKRRFKRVVNGGHFHSDKKLVHDWFAEAAGYGYEATPGTTGDIVKKSRVNATHDGELVEQAKADGAFYSIVIDNTVGPDSVLDYRVPIIGGVQSWCYAKLRPKSVRFSNTNDTAQIMPIGSAFSQTEIGVINQFCHLSQLDYGELDVLRDNKSKKIFVIDANNTPNGPPNGLSLNESYLAVGMIGLEFCKTFIEQ